MGRAKKGLSRLFSLVFPPRFGRVEFVQESGVGVEVRLSGRSSDSPLLICCPGFGSCSADYAPLAHLFGRRYQVARLGHPGFGRWAGVRALVQLWRARRHLDPEQAARKVRSGLHCPANRWRRLAQLELAYRRLARGRTVSLAGHSFGTDTALMLALQDGVELDTLYLFSPHPPGYLIPREDYLRLGARRVVVISGTKDRTRDGVGPVERMQVAAQIPSAESILLEGVAHMDFAFPGWGPKGWQEQLERLLKT